ncbi:MAG TPA: phage tail sheath subtilisin-like domain-containing protein [Gemmatimonadaceae bacterium]|nr:phage tail sheath subtilisin-like domain-containing protein [Gemmatimonadaceae bacterium]
MATVVGGVPGVYVQERRAGSRRALPTGVPVFIGLLGPDAPMPAGTAAGADMYGPAALHHKAEFLGGAAAFLGHAVDGFFDNGGGYCYVVGIKANPAIGAFAAERMSKALALTVALDDVDLVAMPDAQALLDEQGAVAESLVLELQRDMIAHCTAAGNRMALLDGLRDKTAVELIKDQVKQLGIPAVGPVNAAIYHPWLRTIASDPLFVPPCGQVAGIISRTDDDSGVFTAPANAEVRDATDLDAALDPDSLATLNANGVNCIRAFASRGIRVWGARTLSADPDWTYLNVRRLVLTLLRWIDANMAWASFEPNVPALWARIERELTTYLTELWRAGALQGTSASDAFFVRCDAELNPADSREMGQVVTEIGLAATTPAEFIVVSVQHRSGTTELT